MISFKRCRAVHLATGTLLGMALVACQTQSPTETAATDAPTDETSTAAVQVFPQDFEAACNGVPVTQAAAYDKAPGAIHPIYVFAQAEQAESFIQQTGQVPEAWELPWEEAAKTQLVACLSVVDRTLSQKCEFPSDDGGETYVLELYDTIYETSVFAAQTGELLDTTTLDIKASADCPMFHMFTEGEPLDRKNADFAQPLLDFVKPHVQPEA